MRRWLLTLVVVLLLPVDVGAQTLEDYDYTFLRFRGVGLGAGYLWSGRVENREEFHIRFDLGYLGPGVRIIPSVSYWSSRYRPDEIEALAAQISRRPPFTAISADQLGPVEWSDLSLSIDGHFVWNTPIDVLTYVGAGAGFHALNGQGPAINDTFVEDLLDSITAGVAGIVGAEFEPVRRFRVYAEGRYTAMNSMQYLSARGGLQFMFRQDESVRVGSAVPAPELEEEDR